MEWHPKTSVDHTHDGRRHNAAAHTQRRECGRSTTVKLVIAGIISPNRHAVDAFVRRRDTDDPRIGVTRCNYTDPGASSVSVTVWERDAVPLGSLEGMDNEAILWWLPMRRVCANTLHLVEKDRRVPPLATLRDEDNATRIRSMSVVELHRLFWACKTGTERDAAERYVIASEITNELKRRTTGGR